MPVSRITRPQQTDEGLHTPLDLRCVRHPLAYGLHDDRTPSLHVYEDAARGWYCFGCGRGGSIYDLAALLWLTGQPRDQKLRGRDFLLVRQRLAEMFLDKRG